MRHFHLKRNQYYNPIVNIDKLWALVSEGTRKPTDKDNKKTGIPVIDATKAVNYYYIYKKFVGLFQSFRKGKTP